jgi:hypothetical protein
MEVKMSECGNRFGECQNAGKLPLFAIAKGKAARAEQNQLGSDQILITDHSLSGWRTIETFCHLLDFLDEISQDRSHLDVNFISCWIVILFATPKRPNKMRAAWGSNIVLSVLVTPNSLLCHWALL